MTELYEIWKPVNGYEGIYEISNLGRVKSLNYRRTGNEKILKQVKKTKGYLALTLYKNGSYKQHRIHRLVADAFIPNPDNLPQVNHIDEDVTNNRVDNLEWCDNKYNCNYGNRTKRSATSHYKKINQYDLDGKFIKTWSSIKNIESELGFYGSKISDCCRGRNKTSYKYIWRYAS